MPLVNHVGAVVPIPAVHPLVVEDVIPHHLPAILGYWERQTAATSLANGQPVVRGLAIGVASVALGRRKEILRKCGGTVGRVDIHEVGIRILLEQLHLPRG
ncbi:hypothetical protein D9M70_567490 [compost metagenome]